MPSSIRWIVWKAPLGEAPARQGVVVAGSRDEAHRMAQQQFGEGVWVQSEASFEAGGFKDLYERHRAKDRYWLSRTLPGD